MRKLILLLISTFVSIQLLAQPQQKAKEKEISNTDKFTERAGALIKREFVKIGEIKKCQIEVAYYTDLINNQKISAVRFEYEYHSSYSNDTKIAILDADEIDGLIKSIRIIQEKILPTIATTYTEVNFRSRTNFMAGCFSKNSSWDAFLKLEAYDSNSYVFMDGDDLVLLLSLLEQAKSKL